MNELLLHMTGHDDHMTGHDDHMNGHDDYMTLGCCPFNCASTILDRTHCDSVVFVAVHILGRAMLHPALPPCPQKKG